MPLAFMGIARIQAVTLGNFFTVGSAPTSASYGTETNIARACRVAGRFSRLSVNFDANGTARSVRFRKNLADGNLVVSPADSTATTTTDNTNYDTLVDGDTFDLRFVGTAPAFSANVLGINFSAASGHASFYASAVQSYGGTGAYGNVVAGTLSATEADTQTKMRTSGTIKGGQVAVSVASSSTGTMVSRINGSDGTVSVSITSGTTGVFEDNTHTDSFVDGDLINWNVTGVSGSPGLQLLATLTFNVPKNEVGVFINGGFPFDASTQYVPIVGSRVANPATEADAQIAQGFKFTASKMRCYVSANTLASTQTIRLRKNGSNGNQSLSLTATTTGWFEDASNTDTFDPTDLINYSVSGGTSGTATTSALLLTQAPAAITSNNIPMLGM